MCIRDSSTGAAAAQRATISEKPYGSSKRKWREWHMRNNRLLPYETIVQAASGEPEAVGTVLQYYRRRIPVSYTHLQRIMIVPFVGAWFFVPNLKILLPYQF